MTQKTHLISAEVTVEVGGVVRALRRRFEYVPDRPEFDLESPGALGLRLEGVPGSETGRSLALGDVAGDGVDDLEGRRRRKVMRGPQRAARQGKAWLAGLIVVAIALPVAFGLHRHVVAQAGSESEIADGESGVSQKPALPSELWGILEGNALSLSRIESCKATLELTVSMKTGASGKKLFYSSLVEYRMRRPPRRLPLSVGVERPGPKRNTNPRMLSNSLHPPRERLLCLTERLTDRRNRGVKRVGVAHGVHSYRGATGDDLLTLDRQASILEVECVFSWRSVRL